MIGNIRHVVLPVLIMTMVLIKVTMAIIRRSRKHRNKDDKDIVS